MKDMKFDNNKPRMDLIEPEFLEGIAKVLTLGASKYAPDSWKTQVYEPERRYYAAALRHLAAWKKGEKTDPESGLSHLYHAACNLMFLGYFDEVHPTPKSKQTRDPNRTNIKWSGVNHWVLKETFDKYPDLAKTKMAQVYYDALAGMDLFTIEEHYDVMFKHIGRELQRARKKYQREHDITVVYFNGSEHFIVAGVDIGNMPFNVVRAYVLAIEGYPIREVEKQYNVKFIQLGGFFLKTRDNLMEERIKKENIND